MNINKDLREVKQSTTNTLDRMAIESEKILNQMPCGSDALKRTLESLFNDLPRSLAIMEIYNALLVLRGIGNNDFKFFKYLESLNHYKINRSIGIGKCDLSDIRPVESSSFKFCDPLLYSIWTYRGNLNGDFVYSFNLTMNEKVNKSMKVLA